MSKSFSKMKFKPEATSKLGLPDIEYPVPTEKFPMLMMYGGEVKRELLIYWVNLTSSLSNLNPFLLIGFGISFKWWSEVKNTFLMLLRLGEPCKINL